ncbi:MAG TPA: CHAT domain-containing protein [Gemmatimonadaceae bacterium]
MLSPLRVVLAVVLLQQSSLQPPRAVVLSATAAVERDSAAIVERRWRSWLREHPDDRAAILALATLARLRYDFPEAEQLYDRLIPWAGRATDGYAAYAALGRAQELQGRGMVERAVPWYERAAAAARSAGEREAAVEAELGLAFVRGRAQGTAAELAMLDSIERALPAADPRVSAALRCERAALSARTGGRDALALARSGAALARRAGDRRLEARCLHAEALDFVRVGDLDGAGVRLARVEALLRSARDRAGLGAILQWHGYLLESNGDYGAAQPLLREAAAEGEASGNVSVQAWALVDLAQISIGVNDIVSARREAERSTALFTVLGDRWGLATAIGLEGQIALEVGDTTRAREHYQRLLAWAISERQPLAIGDAHHGLADVAAREHHWRAAERELDAQRAALRRGGGTDWEEELSYYYGVVALDRGDVRGAERRLRAGLAALDSSRHARRYLVRATLAEVALRRGDTTTAERELREASAQLDAWRATLGDRELRLLAFQVRDAFGGHGPPVARVIAGIAAAGHVASAFEMAEHRRARDLRDQLARDAAMRGSAHARGPDPTPATPAATLASIQRALPDAGTALLEYVTGGGGQPTTLFVITRGRASTSRLPPLDSLRPAIARLVGLVEGGGDPRALGRALGDALLAPALAALPPGVTRLLIVPDGALYRAPFQLLVAPDGRWMIERYAIATVPSAAVAAALWTRPAPEGPAALLAFGDPRFPDESDARAWTSLLRSAFGGAPLRLPGSADEVRDVARYSPAPVIRLRENASEAFLEHTPLERYRVIHFATHAVVDEYASARTVLALAPGGGEDGLVTTGDLAALHLNADLVVLSACRTARGVVLGGEGMRGLTTPLLRAGARAVIATEWSIGDRTTRAFVDDLYGALADGMDAAGALRRAALAAMRDGAPPREWAAFRLVGDPLVRVPLRRPSSVLDWWRRR